MRELRAVGRCSGPGPDLHELLEQVVVGDHGAFAGLYDAMAGPVYGLVHRVVRDPARSEEVAQAVMVEVWRTAAHYQPERGTVSAWVMTLAHRRAVDRVRSAQSRADRENRGAPRDRTTAFDEFGEQVGIRPEHERARGCLHALTPPQLETITLAYYDGLTYREVAATLSAPLGTIKTRLRDALIRLRDCMS